MSVTYTRCREKSKGSIQFFYEHAVCCMIVYLYSSIYSRQNINQDKLMLSFPLSGVCSLPGEMGSVSSPLSAPALFLRFLEVGVPGRLFPLDSSPSDLR